MKMIEVKTADLVGAALDWAVAYHLNGERAFFEAFGSRMLGRSITEEAIAGNIRPSTDWAQGGPLIESKRVAISVLPQNPNVWCADFPCDESKKVYFGATALSAAMRAIVAAKLGDTVSVPAELVTSS